MTEQQQQMVSFSAVILNYPGPGLLTMDPFSQVLAPPSVRYLENCWEGGHSQCFFSSLKSLFFISDLGFHYGVEFSSPLQIHLHFSFWTTMVRSMGMEGSVRPPHAFHHVIYREICLLWTHCYIFPFRFAKARSIFLFYHHCYGPHIWLWGEYYRLCINFIFF